jgi:NitT/TauT family transport system substrate-binding protein
MYSRAGLAVFAATLFLATACGNGATSIADPDADGSDGGELDVVNVGLVPTVNVAPMILGMEEGFFEEEGLEIETHQADSGGAILTGVVQGSHDFAFTASPPAAVAASEGAPLRIVSGAGVVIESEGLNAVVVDVDSDIESYADLAGATVSVNSLQALFDLCVRAALQADGVDPGDVEIIELPFNQVEPSLDQGQIDAGMLIEPFKTPALDGELRSIGDPCSHGLPTGAPSSIYVTSADIVEDQPELVERFVRALSRSQEYAQDHHDAVREVLPSFTSIEPDQAEVIELETLQPDVDQEAYAALLDVMVDHDFIPSTDSVADLLP